MNYEDINSIDSESGIIASLIHHPEFSFYSENLKQEHFTNRENRLLYYALCELAQKDIAHVDAYNILEALNTYTGSIKSSDDITIEKLNDLMEMSSVLARHSPEEYKMLANNVVNAAFRRDAYACLKKCEGYCLDGRTEDVEQKIYKDIDEVMMRFSATAKIPLYKDIIDDIWSRIQARQKGETKAISFPFSRLNEYVVMEPGEAICFTGSAKTGKSAMLLTCTVHMLKKNKSVLYIDSEISDELFTMRLLSHISGVQFSRIRSGRCTPVEEEQIENAKAWIKTKNFIHIYMPVLSADALYICAKKAKYLIDIDCIVVDYLKADSTKDAAFEVYADLGNISDVLKNKIAGEMGLCCITAAQSTSTGKIADSSRIARSMSTVVAISDKTLDEIENDGTGATKKLRVVFNRNGAQSADGDWIDMVFDGSTCRYIQAERQHYIEEPY